MVLIWRKFLPNSLVCQEKQSSTDCIIGHGTSHVTLSPDGAANLVGSNTVNPGGLQNFRLGVNRNTDSLFAMDMGNVKIYTDSTVSIDDLLAAAD